MNPGLKVAAAVVLLALTSRAVARLGETQAEIESRYGHGESLGPRFPKTIQFRYLYSGFEICVHYKDGKSVLEAMKQRSGKELSDAEIEALLKTVSSGAAWIYSKDDKRWTLNTNPSTVAFRERGHEDWFWIENRPVIEPTADKPPAEKRTGSTSGADFVRSHTGTLVVIKDQHGAGSGFIATLGGQPYLLTNIHVAAEMQGGDFTLLDGTRLQLGAAEAAVGHDIMRFALKTPPRESIPACTDFTDLTRMGDEVFVLGNSGGGGVVTNLAGKIVGIGPDRIEVSASFIPGNSGSPIIHAPSGQAIGIATYLTRRFEEFTDSKDGGSGMVIRHFGYRLDSVRTWEPVDWPVFHKEAEQLHHVSELSEDIVGMLRSMYEHRTPSFATEALRRPALEWNQKLSQKKPRLSETDRLAATYSFLAALRALVHGDIATLEGRLRYSYFRDQLTNERDLRERLYKKFDEESRRIAMPSSRGF